MKSAYNFPIPKIKNSLTKSFKETKYSEIQGPSAARGSGFHPYPFRTRKLNRIPFPIVLKWETLGEVGKAAGGPLLFRKFYAFKSLR